MANLLKTALNERKELLEQLEKVNKVIELLGGDVSPVRPRVRRHNAATRKKMKEAWARRKQQEVPPHDDMPKYGLEEP